MTLSKPLSVDGPDMRHENKISVVVPTYRRAEGLSKTLESLRTQIFADIPVEIVVADNNPDGEAREQVAVFGRASGVQVHYVHAKIPGVSNARNAAMDVASGRYIAFLDDDQYAAPNWLEEMYKVLKVNNCCAVFCQTRACVDETSPHRDYLERFFSRDRPDLETGKIDRFFGAGNSLIDREAVDMPSPVFSLAMNETGGEDDILFESFLKQGGVMGWTKETHVFEDIPAKRQTAKYIRVRSFAFGQGPTRMNADLGPFNLLGITKWMCIGAAQFVVFAPLAAICRIVKPSHYLSFLSKASAGAGKVLWQKPFRPKLYGAGA